METKDFVRMLKNKNNLDEKLNVINQECKKEIIVDDIEVRDWRSALRNKEREYEELRQYHNKCCEENANELKDWLEKYSRLSRDFYSGKYCNAKYCKQLQAKEQECKAFNKQLQEENAKLKQELEMRKANEQESDEFWDGVFDKDYPFNKENAYKELADYYFFLQQIPKIYYEITGGTLSKTNYFASSVILAYRDNCERCQEKQEQEIKNFEKQLQEENKTLKSENFTFEELIKTQEELIDKYEQALDEIEKICQIKEENSQFVLPSVWQQILDIIHKAKGE